MTMAKSNTLKIINQIGLVVCVGFDTNLRYSYINEMEFEIKPNLSYPIVQFQQGNAIKHVLQDRDPTVFPSQPSAIPY